MFTEEQSKQLAEPLDKANVKSRKQGGGTVDYVEGWQLIEEANKIFNFNWNRETIYNKEVSREVNANGNNVVGYEAKVRITVGDIVREGTGHGSGISKNMYDAVEGGAKEAETDAMKRALMTFGYRFGLALYDKERTNVKEVVITDEDKTNPDSEHFDTRFTCQHLKVSFEEFYDNIGGLVKYYSADKNKKRIAKLSQAQAEYIDNLYKKLKVELENK